jgi:hypothetical protein
VAVRAHVRIQCADDDARDARLDHGYATARHRRFVIVRFERHIHRRTAHVFARRARYPQRLGLGVRLTLAVMPPFAERAPIANDHRADRRIRCRIPERARGEFDRTRQIDRVESVYGVTSTPFQNAT